MIRLMREADVDACMALSRAAGWNQVPEDWDRVRRLEPEGCFVFESDGRAVASTTVTRYGPELAWIGMVLTLPDFRRRGIARRLMERALEYCDDQEVSCIKLDASDEGRPLYLDLGFVDEQPIERWSGQIDEAGEAAAETGVINEALALDQAAFGADRRPLLERLDLLIEADGSGFVSIRPGAQSRQLGPCIANSKAAAERLIRRARASAGPGPLFWDLLPANQAAAELATGFGFEPVRRLWRMAHPARDFGDLGLIWATAGFEYG